MKEPAMITVCPSASRGSTRLAWLDARHSFSFGRFVDRSRMGFRALRVLNDDRVAPGGGFPPHPHEDMEIVTVVLDGELAHRDSMGHGATIRPGEVQAMSAGSGITHSEFNASAVEPVRLLQIWILPAADGAAPRYGQRSFPASERAGRLRRVVTGRGDEARDGSLPIGADAELFLATVAAGEVVEHRLEAGRGAWLQVAKGSVVANGSTLIEGDGAAFEGDASVRIVGVEGRPPAEIVLIDLA
jgi:redox-sensitive bicupin YhaK (pirin superfamily)